MMLWQLLCIFSVKNCSCGSCCICTLKLIFRGKVTDVLDQFDVIKGSIKIAETESAPPFGFLLPYDWKKCSICPTKENELVSLNPQSRDIGGASGVFFHEQC